MKIFKPADILIPKNVDFSKWSVVACDQYTSQPDYWEKAKKLADDSPSALNIIFPEIYLNDGHDDERIRDINKTMQKYLDDGIFEELKDSYILVERMQSNGKIRTGIIGCLDLEEYDFSKGSQSEIRATEGTVASRIPPRKKIRINAPLELPHILMLIDDDKKSVIEPIRAQKEKLKKLYDFDLMLKGGHITGYLIDKSMYGGISDALDRLNDKSEFEKKYGVSDKGVLLFAAGDGNHSLATAKSCWEEIKKNLTEEERKNHPARYALAELNNIHDEALEFEPIQRVVFNVNTEDILDGISRYYSEVSFTDNGGQRIDFVYGDTEGSVFVKDAPSNLPVGTLQKYLDDYIEKNGGEIDYIHGSDVVRKLAKEKDTIGFMVEKMDKSELFETVVKDGALPRKTFSMGEACDKRFYLECKKIK